MKPQEARRAGPIMKIKQYCCYLILSRRLKDKPREFARPVSLQYVRATACLVYTLARALLQQYLHSRTYSVNSVSSAQ